MYIIPSYTISLGHVNASLGIVKELVRQGNEVTYYTTKNF